MDGASWGAQRTSILALLWLLSNATRRCQSAEPWNGW